jgi:hypothetical protein
MPSLSYHLHAENVFECDPEGATLTRVQQALDVIGEARSQSASLVVLPMSRLDPAFFQLRSGLAGEILQKFVTYGLKVVILGDFASLASSGKALHDFIHESNRGSSIWFLADRSELEKRLQK